MENTNLTEKATIVPVVKEIRSILDTARSNVARQVNCCTPTGTSAALSASMSRVCQSEQITASRP